MNSSAAAQPVANIDESLKLENTKLRSLNAELSLQNDSLRKQIDKSLQITDKIQEIYKENEKLKSELTRSSAEKEDLQKRLQINYLQIQELTQRANSQMNAKLEFGDKIKTNETIFKQQISELNEQLVSSNIKIEQLQAEKEKYETEKEKFGIELFQLFEKSSFYFNDNIQSIADLLPHLEKVEEPKPSILMVQPSNTIKNEFDEFDNLSRTNSKKSAKNKSIKSEEVFKFKRKIKQLKELLQNEAKKTQEIQNKANDQIRQIENQNELKMIEVTSQINKLSEQLEQQKKLNNEITLKNESLNKENAKLDSQLQLSRIQTAETDSEKVIQLSNHISDLNEKLAALKDVNQEYKNNTIPNLIAKNRSLKTKINLLTDKINHLKELYNDENSKKSTLSDQLEKRSNELLEKISLKETENTKLKFDNETIKNKFNELNNEYKQEKLENETLKQENANLTKIINQSKETIQNIESQLHEYSQKFAKTSAELETTKTKLNVASQPINISKLIPLACWSVPEIPQDLTTIVENIVKNDTLELPTKLRHVLTVICKWFQSKTNRLENEISSTNTNSLTLNGLLETVKEFLKNTFPDFDADKIQEIVDDNNSQAKELFRSYVKKKSDNFNDLFEIKSKMDEDILNLLLSLKVDQIADGIKKVERLYSKNRKLKQVIQKMKNSNKKITEGCVKEIKNIEKTIQDKDSFIDELNRKIELLKEMNAKTENTLKNCETSLKNSEEKIKQLEEKIAEMKVRNQQKIQKKNEIIQKKDELIQSSKKKFDDLNSQYVSSQDKIEELGITINDLHDVINDLTNTKKSLEEKINQLMIQLDEQNKLWKEKTKEIKKQAQQRYDEMLNQMKKQNADCRDTIKNLNNEKLNFIDQNENLEKMITELNLKIQKMELKSSEIAASNNRDKRAQESQYTTQLLSLRNQFQNQIDEVENAKNKMADLIRNQFRPFFNDMKYNFDQRSVEDIINLVGQKLKSAQNN